MSTTYIVATGGYTNCPEYSTLKEARQHLKELVAESVRRAKAKSKTARKHKDGEDSYSITLGSDRRSALWSSHYIVISK